LADADLHGLLVQRRRSAAEDVLLLSGMRCLDLRAGCGCLGPPGGGERAADRGADESVNEENIRAELSRLKALLPGETDSVISRAMEHRIAELERDLEKTREKETKL
jgi:hypothetical protein